jgi:hypothetical protein
VWQQRPQTNMLLGETTALLQLQLEQSKSTAGGNVSVSAAADMIMVLASLLSCFE